MHPFKEAPMLKTLGRHLRHLARRSDTLTLGSAPLHTEDPRHAAQAPAQVEAACRRRPHVVGLTETRGPSMAEAKRRAEVLGYQWFQAAMDPHRNVSILVKQGLKVLNVEDVVVNNNHRLAVTFLFHGSEVTVYQMHWERTDNEKNRVQTNSLVQAMEKTSAGTGLSFYMGDSNPSKPQHMPGSQPDTALAEAKMPVIYDEVGHFPPSIGVNVIGRNLADTRVSAVKVETHPALGSDHVPATATYEVKRLRKR